MKSGRGPVYMDCRGASKEDIEYMEHWLRNEGNVGLLNHKKIGVLIHYQTRLNLVPMA